MNRVRTAVVALVLAALVTTAQPAAAASANELVVVDSHTTTAEFESATEHTNVSVTNGAVTLDTGTFSFEDQPADSGLPDGWEFVNSASDGSHNVTTQTASDGSQSYGISLASGASSQASPTGAEADASTGPINASLYLDGVNGGGGQVGLEVEENGSNTARVFIQEGDLKYVNASGEKIVIKSGVGDQWVHIGISDIDPSADTYDIYWRTPTDSGTVNDAEMEGAMTDGFDNVVVAGYQAIGFADDIQVGKTAPPSGTYISETLTGSDIDAGRTNLTLVNATATVTWLADTDGDGTFETQANSSTYSTNGTYLLDISGVSSDHWRVNVTFYKDGTDPIAKLGADAILFDARSPSATLQAPADGEKLSDSSVDFTVNVSDPDFETAQGDTVNATLFVDGDIAGSQTVASNQTVTISETVSGGGNHTYYWTLSDGYGESTTTATRTIKTPTQISIYNETNPSQLLDNTTFQVTMYFGNESGPALVEERTVSDGTINLTGLPAGESFVVSVEGDGWVDRRVVVPSIYETQRIYMLNSSAQTTPVIFKLEDFTGKYPQANTTLLVQRGINGTYQTVLGDRFGATGQFPATLATGVRHQLVLFNTNTGERRVAGTYTPLAGGEQTITVSPKSGIDVLGIEPTVDWIPGTMLIPATDNATIGARLSNRSATIQSWNITAVHAPPSGSNTTLWTYSASTNGGRQVTTENLSGLRGHLRIDVTYTLATGATETRSRLLSLQAQSDAFRFGLLGQLDSAPAGLLPAGDVDAATTAIALMLSVFGMAVVATSTGTTSELTAGVGVLILGGFSVIGWVGYPLVATTGVAWIGLTAIRRGVV